MWSPIGFHDRNEDNVNALARNDWRASLVPAAAVIPAPIVYIKVVAVKKLVVGPLGEASALASGGDFVGRFSVVVPVPLSGGGEEVSRDRGRSPPGVLPVS
jgi:hypothetical protein